MNLNRLGAQATEGEKNKAAKHAEKTCNNRHMPSELVPFAPPSSVPSPWTKRGLALSGEKHRHMKLLTWI